ncbi:DNA/RNA non-specific endonuclease [Butyrivibrio sp. VCB2006]|uniref:DNA/RNA non-specific endonuclease n=1 Tax=Butyrivibrio sp. VCB2006 TaxID=1280679 RepID=UPI00041DCE75|nr:DNA/RNA non-specific endonuclease [Butyrivibrio sp. VCB2006]
MRVNSFLQRKLVFLYALCIFLTYFSFSIVETSAQETILEYSGYASIALNNNVPQFSSQELSTNAYETYGALDKLGRCTTAISCIGTELMPTESRGSIGMIKPTGWNQNKYPGIVDSNPPYLYNRCHLIGYQLTAENANERNLITGTRYFNIEGMLPYENSVANYIKSTGNHVMYRVTPYFEGNNLLCSGAQIEAYSVEDNGKGISFNVFCYNVQPGVVIDYKTGKNYLDENYTALATTQNAANATTNNNKVEQPQQPSTTPALSTASYVANKNTKKFHYASCSSVQSMKEKNKLYYEGSRDDLVSQGYDPCKKCNP